MARWAGFALLLALPGCSQDVKDLDLRFSGKAPYGAIFTDTRAVVATCHSCSQPVPADAPRCPNLKEGKACGQKVRLPAVILCGFCRGSKKCEPCEAFETGGRCRYCGGAGRLGNSKSCFNCGGSGACVACGGSAGCDACGGAGTLTLPWSRRASAAPVFKGAAPARGNVTQDKYIAWRGESVSWSGPTGNPSDPWTVFVIRDGRRDEAGRASGNDARFKPGETGSYMAVLGKEVLYFECIEMTVRGQAASAVGPGTPLTGAVEFNPRIRDVVVRWELVKPGGAAVSLDGAVVSAPSEGAGRYELWPVATVPSLPPRRGLQPAVFHVSDLRILLPSGGPFPAGLPVAFEAASNPPLPPEAAYEWTAFTAEWNGSIKTSTPQVKFTFPKAARYKLQVRSGGCASAPVEIAAYRVYLLDGEGRRVTEVKLPVLEGAFDAQGRLPEEAILGAAERVRVAVDDP